MKTKTVTSRKKWAHMGIRGKLVLCLIIFSAIMLLAVWFFQIRMLGYFYEREKFLELRSAGEELSHHLKDGALPETVERIAAKNDVCVRVFVMVEGKGVQLVDAGTNADCMIHHLSGDLVADFYTRAVNNGGEYDKRVSFDRGTLQESDGSSDFRLPGLHNTGKSNHAVYARVEERGVSRYLILLDSEMAPLNTTVRTLQVQFTWTAMVLMVAAVLMALILSRIIVKPLSNITQKAGSLASGNYGETFHAKGYREVEVLADTLNYAAREIGTTDRLQKELIANISHDLRTPLTMIKGYGEMMRDLPGENNPENAQVLIDEATRLSELVSDLLDLSKLQSGAKHPTREPLDLVALLNDTLKRYESLVRREGYRILADIPEGKAPVLADRTMLLQVIYNLINNAVNYTGEGRTVQVTLTLRETHVRVAVTDDGEGIAPEDLEGIWERYYRVDKVHRRAVMGTGLGLSIVKQVLEGHGAEYGVTSTLGVGSTFWFELPLDV